MPTPGVPHRCVRVIMDDPRRRREQTLPSGRNGWPELKGLTYRLDWWSTRASTARKKDAMSVSGYIRRYQLHVPDARRWSDISVLKAPVTSRGDGASPPPPCLPGFRSSRIAFTLLSARSSGGTPRAAEADGPAGSRAQRPPTVTSGGRLAPLGVGRMCRRASALPGLRPCSARSPGRPLWRCLPLVHQRNKRRAFDRRFQGASPELPGPLMTRRWTINDQASRAQMA
jgi:hypothetical protein